MNEETENPVGPASSAEELFSPDKKPDGTEKFLDRPQRSNDRVQLKEKAISDKQKALQDENDLRAVLLMPEGVRFIAKIIAGPCGWNLPYFHPSNSVMCEVAGRRSIAYQLEQWICDVDLSLWNAVRAELEKSRPKPKTSEKPKRGS
jgi:hypothetical protein